MSPCCYKASSPLDLFGHGRQAGKTRFPWAFIPGNGKMRHCSWLSYKYCCLIWLFALLGLLFNSKKPKQRLGDLANMLQPTHNHSSVGLPVETLITSGGFPIARPPDGRVQGNALCLSSRYQSSALTEHFQSPCCSSGPHNSLDKTPASVQTEGGLASRLLWRKTYTNTL